MVAGRIVLVLVAVLGLTACGPEAVPVSMGRTPVGVLSEADALAVAKRIALPVDALAPLGLTGTPDIDHVDFTIMAGCGTELSLNEQHQALYVRVWGAELETWVLGDYRAVSYGAVHASLRATALLERLQRKADDCGMGEVVETMDAGPGSVSYCLRRLTMRGDEATECVLFLAQDLPGYTLVAAFGYQHADGAKSKAGLLQMAPRIRTQLTKA